jgi:hypothetical protein
VRRDATTEVGRRARFSIADTNNGTKSTARKRSRTQTPRDTFSARFTEQRTPSVTLKEQAQVRETSGSFGVTFMFRNSLDAEWLHLKVTLLL